MANEINVTLGQTAQNVTARLVLAGVLDVNIITCTELAGVGGQYVGTMPAVAAGFYQVLFYADTTLRGAGQIEWDGAAEVTVATRLAASAYTVPPTVVQTRQEMDANSTRLAHLNSDTPTNFSALAITGAGKVDVNDKTGFGLADGALTSAKIADGALLSAKFADSFLTAAKIATDAIDADALATDAIAEIVTAVFAHIVSSAETVDQKLARLNAPVGSIPTNPLLTNDGRLNALDAPISGIPTNPLLTTDGRLDDLDAPISGIPTNPLLTNDARLPAGSTPISTLTQAQVLSDSTPFPGADIALIKTDTGNLINRLGAFVGSGVNTVLGFLQAIMRSDASVPSGVGGTFDPATDSEQALSAAIGGIPTNPLLTNDSRLNNLNAPVGSIPTNPLLTNDARLPSGATPISTLTQADILSDATPFPGADIALIKAKTDLITTPLTLTQIVNGVWNELLAGHTTPGSAAQLLIDASTAADAPTVLQIVNGILNELLSGHVTAGTVGLAIGTINAIYAILVDTPPQIVISDDFDSQGNLHLTRYQSYSAVNGNQPTLTVSVTTDPSGASAYWTFLQNRVALLQVPATLLNYNSGAGRATYGLTLTSVQTALFTAKQGGQDVGSFSLGVVLSGVNILQLVPYTNGKLIVNDAAQMPP